MMGVLVFCVLCFVGCEIENFWGDFGVLVCEGL